MPWAKIMPWISSGWSRCAPAPLFHQLLPAFGPDPHQTRPCRWLPGRSGQAGGNGLNWKLLSIWRCNSWLICSASTRKRASSMLIKPSLTMSTATLTEALAVRFAIAGLQHIQLAFFHGEFYILHIAVMTLQLHAGVHKLLVNPGQLILQFGYGHRCVRMPATTSSP